MSRISARLRASWHVATGTGSAASFSLGMLVLACVFISVAGPRVSQHSLTSVLQKDIASTSAQGRSVSGTIGYSQFDVGEKGAVPASDIRLARDDLLAQVSARLPAQAGQEWSGESTAYVPCCSSHRRRWSTAGSAPKWRCSTGMPCRASPGWCQVRCQPPSR